MYISQYYVWGQLMEIVRYIDGTVVIGTDLLQL